MKTYPTSFSSATIHEYRMINPSLAKVTCSIVKGATKDKIAASITAALGGAGMAVPGSFRSLNETTAVGFVAASRETRVIDSVSEIAKNYRVLSSNLYLDNSDKSLWELKEGASGKYLARNGVDNLESLVQASRVSPTGSIPRLNRVITAAVEKHEIVAFVAQTKWTTDVNYGFCTAAKDGNLSVITDDGMVTVSSEAIVASYELPMPKGKKASKASVFNEPVANMAEYYKLLYGNIDGTGPGTPAQQAYLEKILAEIEELALV